MNVANFAERNHIWARFKRAMITLLLPLFMLAVIPTIITLAASLPFAVNFFSAILPLFGVAAYAAYSKYGVTGLLSVVGVFGLGLLYKLLNSISAIGPRALTIPTGQSNRIKGSGASIVILISMVILFGGAAYFAGRLYGNAGALTVIVVLVIFGLTLGALTVSWV